MAKAHREGGEFQSGLPAAQSGEDVPRWLVVLGLAAGLTLFVALLRYAVDLLGVVFVIILVGFAIRSVSDWLTEGEAVSGWAMSALSISLIGTILIGIWLFNSGDSASDLIETRLPGPVHRSVGWLERQGWGQRVLLPGSPDSGALGGRLGADVASGGSTSPGGSAQAPVAPRMAPALPVTSRPSNSRRAAERRRDISEAEAAPAAAPVRPDEGSAATSSAPDAPAPAAVATALALSVSPVRAVVGTSVRLTATLTPADAAAAPRGMVLFYRGDHLLGRVPVRRSEDSYRAMLVTLDLPMGDHDLYAAYEGDDGHAPSRSAVVHQAVVRK